LKVGYKRSWVNRHGSESPLYSTGSMDCEPGERVAGESARRSVGRVYNSHRLRCPPMPMAFKR
jgi:hypothetical protein